VKLESIMPPDSIPELSENVQLEYLAEGGANIVYRIYFPPSSDEGTTLQPSEIEYYGNATPPPTEIEEHDLMTTDADIDADTDIDTTSGKLLRLRKNVRFGRSYSETANDFQSKVRPLFKPEELVGQFLVRVPSSLIQRCNEKLRESERTGKQKQRPIIRHGVYLATDEPLGMLITDMTDHPTHPTAKPTKKPITVAELKPKWLVQSPSAPKAAIRCRTCALRDMKAADAGVNPNTNGLHTPSSDKAVFCPLDLISNNEQDMQRTIANIFARHRPSPNQIRIIARRLYQHPTLLKLHLLQRLHNKVGLHGPLPGSREMSLSMALRDCSIFLKVSKAPRP
jgi:inositol-pentakisphosphate 2-kinase